MVPSKQVLWYKFKTAFLNLVLSSEDNLFESKDDYDLGGLKEIA